jgi:hypothetical protein
MSNFSSLSLVTESLIGTAVSRFSGSTPDSYATIIAAGYLNDIAKKVKANDVFDINYADNSNFPLNTGQAALFGSFRVQYDPVLGNWNLVPSSSNQNGLAAYGVYAASYNYAGGSASFTINDPSITPNSVVIGRVQSSINAAIVKKMLPGNGTLAVVLSTDPGASVFSYINILPNEALLNAGVIAAQYSNPGGSATIVISNPLITAAMEANVNFASQANSSEVKTAICGAGTLTIVCTADPGVSVMQYVAVLPSSALTTLGFYGATYTNAGGSATTTITDSNISAASIVVADWASQANAVEIEKVTPGAGSLVILSSGDPGASVLNYSAVPGAEGSAENVYLPLAGGQMLGSVLLDRGVATSTAGAATINHQAGVVTTESLSTASGSAYSFTLTNSRITTASIVLCQLLGGTNTKHGLSFTAVPSNGSAAISVLNNDISAAALNGTLIFGFVVI